MQQQDAHEFLNYLLNTIGDNVAGILQYGRKERGRERGMKGRVSICMCLSSVDFCSPPEGGRQAGGEDMGAGDFPGDPHQ